MHRIDEMLAIDRTTCKESNAHCACRQQRNALYCVLYQVNKYNTKGLTELKYAR